LTGFVHHWRSVDKTALVDRLPLVLLREEAAALAASASEPVKARLEALQRRVTAVFQTSRFGAALSPDAHQVIAGELAFLRAAHAALDRAARQTAAGQQIVASLVADLIAALTADPWDSAATGSAAGALGTTLDALPRLATTTQAMSAAIAELRPAMVRMAAESGGAGMADLDAASSALAAAGDPVADMQAMADRQAALTEIVATLASMKSDAARWLHSRVQADAARVEIQAAAETEPTVAEVLRGRVEQLGQRLPPDDLAALLRISDDLRRMERAEGTVETMVEGDEMGSAAQPQPLDIAFTPGLLFSSAEAGSAAVARHILTLDVITNLVVAGLIGAVGVLVLWTGNTTWGSYPDVIGALLAGAGTRLAIPAVKLPITS